MLRNVCYCDDTQQENDKNAITYINIQFTICLTINIIEKEGLF